jgi:hypothetical protein
LLVLVPGVASAAWSEPAEISPYGSVDGLDVDRRGVASVDFSESFEGTSPSFLKAAARSPRASWVRSVLQPSDLPLDAEGRRGRGVAHGPEGHVVAWRIDAAGELLAAVGRDGVFAPALRLAGPVSGMRAWAAVNGLGEAVVVWKDHGSLVAAISDSAGFGPPREISPITGVDVGPEIAFNDAGDIVVAWATKNGVRAVTRRADAGWGPSVKVSRGSAGVGRLSLAMDVRGEGILLWAAGPRKVFGSASYLSRVMSASHLPGAGAWSTPRLLGRGALIGTQVAMDGSGAALAVWSQPVGRGVRYLERPPGGAWRDRGRLPGADCCLTGLTMAALGDAAVAVGPSSSPYVVGVLHRSAGTRAWRPAPTEIGRGLLGSIRMAANAAGDLVVTWNDDMSNTSFPLYAAAYEAPAPAALRKVAARPARAARPSDVRLAVDASRAGRVLVTVRRAGQRRVQVAFITAVRAGRTSVRLPVRAARAIGRGRYVVEVESGSRALGARPSAKLTVLGALTADGS